jgi:hypothetical protein
MVFFLSTPLLVDDPNRLNPRPRRFHTMGPPGAGLDAAPAMLGCHQEVPIERVGCVSSIQLSPPVMIEMTATPAFVTHMLCCGGAT